MSCMSDKAFFDTKAFSFWDSLIVEAALTSGCICLLSEDMEDGLVINVILTIHNPFATENN